LYLGDIIVGLNDKPVQSVDDLHLFLDESTIGKVIDLDVLRNSKRTKIQVIPGELV